MATEKSTTVEQFKVDTTTQESQVLTTILERYQRMVAALEECFHKGGNRLCMETHNLVSDLLEDLDEPLLSVPRQQ